MSEVRSSVDPEQVKSPKVKLKYPFIRITDMNKYLSVVLTALEKGDMQLVGTLHGVTKSLMCISGSAYNIHKLLRVTTLEFVPDEETSIEINNIVDYLEAYSSWT